MHPLIESICTQHGMTPAHNTDNKPALPTLRECEDLAAFNTRDVALCLKHLFDGEPDIALQIFREAQES